MSAFPEKLLSGYQSFKANELAENRELYRELAEKGQSPETMVIACSDSRTAPETIFNTPPGEIFVVRSVANLVPPYQPEGPYHSTSAALEYAVQALKVKNIVVLGHGRCGGVGAALQSSWEPLSTGDFVGKWIELMAPVAKTVVADENLAEDERQMALEWASVQNSVLNLRTFPFIAELEGQGSLALHGAWFDIADGELWTMDGESGDFSRPVEG